MNAIAIFGDKTGCYEAFLRRAIVAGLNPRLCRLGAGGTMTSIGIAAKASPLSTSI
jgi:hypothetical protein